MRPEDIEVVEVNHPITLRIQKLLPDAKIPRFQTQHSAGLDLSYCGSHPILVTNMGCSAIPTGLAMEIPSGYEGQIRLRSSLGVAGLIMPNAPGTIDSDYRGEVKVLCTAWCKTGVEIAPGQRIAQLLIKPCFKPNELEAYVLQPGEQLSSTQRGDGGFGSTGQK